jgi:hypothetical protein
MASIQDLMKNIDYDPLDLAETTTLIENTPDNVLTKGDFKQGKYFGIQFNDDGDVEWQVSPKIKISFTYINEKEDISYFKINKYMQTKVGWKEVGEIQLSKFGMVKIRALLNFLRKLDLKGIYEKRIELAEGSVQFDPKVEKKIQTYLATPSGKDLLEELVNSGLKTGAISRDLVNTGYRRQQLEIFRQLLKVEDYVSQYRVEHDISATGDEAVWQHFFERNKWIFGYGLTYIWCKSLDDKKLEQVVSGFSFTESGKRVDVLMHTLAAIKQFVLVEIKTAKTPLLKKVKEPYRSECWAMSGELSGAIAQVHKTRERLRKKVFIKFPLKDKEGNPRGIEVYSFNTKSYVLIGNLDEFVGRHGVNEDKYWSFELLRNSLIWPEIITYDGLYERAKHIIEEG